MYYPGKILTAIGAGGVQHYGEIPTVYPYPQYQSFAGQNPVLIFIGPSGNVARAPQPQEMNNHSYVVGGGAIRISCSGWSSVGSIGTNCCVWGGNELVFMVDPERETNYGHGGLLVAFCPYGTTGIKEIPPAHGGTDSNVPSRADANPLGRSLPLSVSSLKTRIQDQTYYRWLGCTAPAYYKNASLLTICERAHLFDTSRAGAGTPRYRNAYYYGGRQHEYYTNAELIENGGAGSGYISIFDGFAMVHPYNAIGAEYGSTRHSVNFDATSAWDVHQYRLQQQTLFFNGLIYCVGDSFISVGIPAAPCGYGLTPILREGSKDLEVGQTGDTKYIALSPRTYAYTPYNAYYRCPIKFDNRLLLLQNDGRLFEVANGQVSLLTDIKEALADSAWFSGVYGGGFGYGDNNTAYKSYGVQLGSTLHVFLNYLKDGHGGVCWATSTDLENFTDRTTNLPASGIIPPSGMTSSTYLGIISPYQFSGYNDFYTTGPDHQPLGATACQPSGWIQASGIGAVWHGSGTFLECDYAQTPDGWDIPMYYGSKTVYLRPTYVQMPICFTEQLEPSGTGFTGYSWNGVSNYHIYGIKDETAEKVHLFFSPDVVNNTGGDLSIDDNNPPAQNLYYTLDSSNVWEFKNQFRTKRLSWVEPTDMIEPSILLESGNYYKRFPYEDRVNSVVYQPFRIYDWPFFTTVDLQVQYTTDYGDSWHDATPHSTLSCSMTGLSTGSIASDPSGIIGQPHTFAWDYVSDVGGGRHDHVQFRIRAVGY